MTRYLFFRLYGPMASWGDIAVGEARPSYMHPSKSAVMGLVAAALGIRRDEEERHRRLSAGYGFAVLVESPGIPLSDYHTAQVPSSGTGRNRRIFHTRRDEITTVAKHDLNTVPPSRRDYRMDAFYTVGLWPKDNAPYELQHLADSLNAPVYTLYLGRKSCPLALPVEAQIVNAGTLVEAFNRAQFVNLEELHSLPRNEKPALYWEAGKDSGMEPQHTFVRRDVPLSRTRWQFDIRQEHHASYSRED